jgi:Zn-dependent protease with chaperone function
MTARPRSWQRIQGWPAGRRLGLPAAIVGAVIVAEAAVWLLRPDVAIEPASVPEARYFTASELERADDFAGGQRLLGLGSIAVQGIVLVVAVARPPRRAVRLAERATGGRALMTGALVGAGLVAAIELAPLPLQAIARQRAVDVGLSTQSWDSWALDVVKSLAVGLTLAAAGAALFLALMRRFPRRWWLSAAAAAVAIEVLFVWLAPVVLAPIFNRYSKLPPGPTRTDVFALARRAGIDVGDVLVVDASRRTRAANAYVTGLGPTKRVVLYDTLIARFTPAQTRLVVAHELGHVKHRDVLRGMLWVALVAPAGMYVVMGLTRRWSPRAGVAPGAPASLPAFALALALVTFGGTVISNQLSRRVEANADAFALELTREPDQFIRMQKRLAVVNLADPSPPRVIRRVFGTHPATIERIGMAAAFERASPGLRRNP